jgi:hypothetical protein
LRTYGPQYRPMENSLDEPSFAPKQREVQRRLGRCLMRLQKVELIAKALWVGHECVTSLDGAPDHQGKRKDYIRRKTLGNVLKELTGSYLRGDLGSDDEAPDEWPESEVDPARVVIRSKTTIGMSEDDHRKAVSDLADLVDLRNGLVHHFIERFDLWSEDGCDAAIGFLDESDAKIEGQLAVMQSWFSTWRSATESLVAFSRTEDFFSLLNQGRTSDGRIDWRYTPVVQALREAESQLSDDGWTKLSDAISWLGNHYPNETPAGYGCARWRHLLHESGLFEIARLSIAGENPEIGIVFRSRSAS